MFGVVVPKALRFNNNYLFDEGELCAFGLLARASSLAGQFLTLASNWSVASLWLRHPYSFFLLSLFVVKYLPAFSSIFLSVALPPLFLLLFFWIWNFFRSLFSFFLCFSFLQLVPFVCPPGQLLPCLMPCTHTVPVADGLFWGIDQARKWGSKGRVFFFSWGVFLLPSGFATRGHLALDIMW